MQKSQIGIPSNLPRSTLITLVYLVFFARFLKNSFSYLDSDLGLHLRVGRDIWFSRDIPRFNTYNFDAFHFPCVDHEWLFDLILFLLNDFSGYVALTFIFALFPLATLWLSSILMKILSLKPSDHRESANVPALFYLLAFFGFYASLPHLGIRMQELPLLFIPLLLLLLYRSDRRKTRGILFIFPPLFYLWANLHGSFPVGFLVLASWLFVKLIAFYLPQCFKSTSFFSFGRPYNPQDFLTYLVASLLSFAVTLLTPYGLDLYGLLLDYPNTYFQLHVYEWQPFHYYPLYLKQIGYMALYIVIFVIFVHTRHSKTTLEIQTPACLFALSLFLFLWSLKSKRHFPLFFIASLPLLSYWLAAIITTAGIQLKRAFGKPLIRCAVLVILLLYLGQLLVTTHFTSTPFHSYCHQYPCRALEHMKSGGLYENKKIFNMYHWGGYLLWVWPEKRIFIDGRFPQLTFANKHSLLEEYHLFFNKREIEGKMNEYGIDAVLLSKEYEPAVNWIERTFANFEALENDKFKILGDYLRSAPGWKIDYEDDICVIFVRSMGT